MGRVWVAVAYCLIAFAHCTRDGDKNNRTDAFVATDRWQPVAEGQAIPRGLHVRMNLETKVVEAKLLDPNEDERPASTAMTEVPNERSTINASLEEALKKLPGETLRTLEEIETDFKEANVNVKTDIEILHDLLKRYDVLVGKYLSTPVKEKSENRLSNSPFSADLLDVFVDLEYLLHQYDNANEFVRVKGLENVVYPHLNGTENALKSEALKLLAVCLQNNIRVQTYALETSAGEMLLRILSLDDNEHVKTRAVRSLGCLVRGFPAAQRQLVAAERAMDVLQNILLSDNPVYFKLKFQLLTLLDDLVIENRLVVKFHSHSPENDEKIRQYREVDLVDKLSNPIFCSTLGKLLREYFEYDRSDLENVHRIVASMMTFSEACKRYHFDDKKILVTFHKMQSHFKKNMSTASGDDEDAHAKHEYYVEIIETIDKYIDVLHEYKMNDEL